VSRLLPVTVTRAYTKAGLPPLTAPVAQIANRERVPSALLERAANRPIAVAGMGVAPIRQ
jgi:hypothetical protein